ncbi:MAG: hypothetical protein J5570_07290 [Lachnospiraceae bacterium]|nr:hypothetical protein [Lachnospiraceae bacterium]
MQKIKKGLKLLVVLPMLLVLVFVNIYEDPANMFHDPGIEIAQAILDGQQPYFTSANGDEREVKKYLIENIDKHVDCVTVGPSLSLEIGREHVGTDSYYNLSASAMNYNDYMAVFGLLDLNEIQYDKVIICVDAYFFDDYFVTDSWNPDYMNYASYMISKLEGKDYSLPENGITGTELKNKLSLMFSVSYFQSSLDFIKSNGSVIPPEARWGIADENTDVEHYLPDGSIEYGQTYRNQTVEDIIGYANSIDVKQRFGFERSIDDYYKAHFEMLIGYLEERGVEVEFFLCPICPALWDKLQEAGGDRYLLYELEQYSGEIAEKYGINVVGSYDPYRVGVDNSDFYDCFHLRRYALERYYQF